MTVVAIGIVAAAMAVLMMVFLMGAGVTNKRYDEDTERAFERMKRGELDQG